ncbi:peptidase S41 [Niabella ginsenosidivorans]|uniref:Peptidase S41 n=1 Tax=Niabella ginsenosidivorans TaxID=1176587 RepID=A0A1A9I5W9_9BACT|nr:S41 family peptidase [Niabella ginsenosidivorans]ANH83006.1 peptidase S41 [Niabella ginsenosidivorans]
MRGLLFFMIICCFSCSYRKAYSPNKKFSPRQLRSDFDLYRTILEKRHPGLYWYTSRPVMDSVFNEERKQLKDSLTETEFRKILSRVSTRIECGHTSVHSSKAYQKYMDSLKGRPLFPVYLKVWNDTAVVAYNMNKKDTALTRGTLVVSFDDIPVRHLLDTFYQYLPADGNNRIAKDQRLSIGSAFGDFYAFIYGRKDSLKVGYRGSGGHLLYTFLRLYTPAADTAAKATGSAQNAPKKTRDEKLGDIRSLKIDTVRNFAIMNLGSFSQHLELKSFFRQSFKELQKRKIKELIVDLRTNGGGSVNNAMVFTRYLAKQPYKIGDSLLLFNKTGAYSRYLRKDKMALWVLQFFIHKKKDGYYHFSYYERHKFGPKRRFHYNGAIYLLTGGMSFSATTMVVNALKGQENVTIVGEPTGGAAYGNSAFLIPNILLPHTKIRCRLPIYRFVMNRNLPMDGKGVWPDVYVGASIDAIRRGRDYKMDCAEDLILKKRKQ